jgi:ribosomal protein S18 acetylase RimI-like enzyme
MSDLQEGLTIRKIKEEDAEAISRIQAAITKGALRIDFSRIIQEQLRKDEAANFVAEWDGRVIGFMISYVVYGGYGLEKSAWIATFGVDPKFMGQGIGKRLAEEILEVYQRLGIRHVYTSVRWDSADLLSFFKTLGFDRSDFINLVRKMPP